MTIEAPEKDALAGVDWAALDAVLERAKSLVDQGRMTKDAYAELWREGLEATDNRPELLETLAMFEP